MGGRIKFRGYGRLLAAASLLAVLVAVGCDIGAFRASMDDPGGSTEEPEYENDIAFVSNRTGGDYYYLYLMDPDGTNVRQLTTGSMNSKHPDWSPDKTKIIFSSSPSAAGSNQDWSLRITDYLGSYTSLVTSGSNDIWPDWGRDDRKILLDRHDGIRNNIYSIWSYGQGFGSVLNDSNERAVPCWHPDGSKFTYMRGGQDNYCVWVADSDGSNETQLTTIASNEECRNPVWSPDGTKIAYHSGDRIAGDWDIWIMDADGSNKTAITSGTDNNNSPDWSSDGTRIIFCSDRDGDYDIYIINTDGTGLTQIVDSPGDDKQPVWQ